MANLNFLQKTWDPFKETGLMPRNLDRLFEDFYSPRWRKEVDQTLSPSVDVKESKVAYALKFDLPGVGKDQVKIDLHDNTLTVSGERREERKEDDKEKKTHLAEVFYGSFSRTFTFPEAVDAERAEAKFENGVLALTIPKKETTMRRQITIK